MAQSRDYCPATIEVTETGPCSLFPPAVWIELV